MKNRRFPNVAAFFMFHACPNSILYKSNHVFKAKVNIITSDDFFLVSESGTYCRAGSCRFSDFPLTLDKADTSLNQDYEIKLKKLQDCYFRVKYNLVAYNSYNRRRIVAFKKPESI